MIRGLLAAAITVTALTGCGKSDLSDEPHSVEEYMANDRLSAETIEACRARNEAELRVMQAKAACANVREAERKKFDAGVEEANAAFSAAMEKRFKEERQKRAKEQ